MIKTQLIKKNEITEQVIEQAAQIILNGGLVAFPTETVYGLGANGLNIESYKKVFEAKRRPSDNPLIFHISSATMLDKLVKEIPKEAKELMKTFWPGPLTLVFKKDKKLPRELTCSLDTIAIRMPDNNIALKLIQKSNVPLVAPSGNTSGKPSPTNAQHVYDDLQGKISMILDGGQTEVGIESTVLDISKKPFTLLRPGKITNFQLEKVLQQKIRISKENHSIKRPSSPGMKYKHYAPNANVFIISNKEEEVFFLENNKKDKTLVLLYTSKKEMAKNIFSDFRKADLDNFKNILVYQTSLEGLGSAIMNRVQKAVSKK
jgi:L-threonylcarbamoyladenylate synthase